VGALTRVLVLRVGFVVQHVERDSGRRDDRQRDPTALAVHKILKQWVAAQESTAREASVGPCAVSSRSREPEAEWPYPESGEVGIGELARDHLQSLRVREDEPAFVLAGNHGRRVLVAFSAALRESCDAQEQVII
jgi:hypothetical protein